MSFSKPKAPKEDPAVTAARQAEEARAQADLTAETQQQLLTETRNRRKDGSTSLLSALDGSRRTLLGAG